jgi:dTDP-4-amino-4,6-dideoxy-D-galactose acyltransferase
LRFEKDGWLSDVLGVSSWKVLGLGTEASSREIKAGLVDCDGGAAAFFSARIPTADALTVSKAIGAGFSVVDVNVTLDWDADAVKLPRHETNRVDTMTVTAAEVVDAAAIEAIAARCFIFSRFHLDPLIGRERANEIKRRWAANACRGRASAVYVARVQGTVAGFLAVLLNDSARKKDAVIDLVGVDAAYQGRGAGLAMSRMFVEQWRDRADRLRVGTQISNIPALRLYESLGFRVAETSYVLHAHTRNGALAA